MGKENHRFVMVYRQSTFGSVIEVWQDKQTGIQYIFRHDGHAGGLTPLLDRDGRPLTGPAEGSE